LSFPMTPESPAARPPRRRTPRVPPFYPVPLRSRRDGWSAEIQARFLALLAVTGSVSDAAERVGMSRNGAYRLRRRPGAESFAAAAAWSARGWAGRGGRRGGGGGGGGGGGRARGGGGARGAGGRGRPRRGRRPGGRRRARPGRRGGRAGRGAAGRGGGGPPGSP